MNGATQTEATAQSEFGRHWLLVIGCALGVSIGVSSLVFYTSGLFIGPLMAEFGWSRTAITAGGLAGSLASAALLPVVGAAIDRFGLVPPVALSLAGLVIGFVFFGLFITSFYWSFVLLNLALSTVAGASTPLAYTRAINAAFDRNRGVALGLTLSGMGIAGFLAPPLLADVIENHGWRVGYFALAATIAVLAPVVLVILARAAPRRGAPTAAAKGLYVSAIRTPTFWLIGFGVLIMSLGLGGMIVHFVPILMDGGRGAREAAQVAGVIGAAVILGRVVVGYAMDRVFAPHVAVAAIAVCATGALLLASGNPHWAVLGGFAIGFAMGGEADLIGYLVARYFDISAYGRLYGLQYSIFILGMTLSPVWIGVVRDANASYEPALLTSAGLMALAALFFLTLPRFPIQSRPRPMVEV